jgi:hypothetical protein
LTSYTDHISRKFLNFFRIDKDKTDVYRDKDVSRFTDYTDGTKGRLYTGSEFPVNTRQILNPISWSLKLNDAGV